MSLFQPTFLVALALLWLPRQWMQRGARVRVLKHRSRHQPNRSKQPADSNSLFPRRDFAKARNYYDLFRAAVGTWTLFGGWGVEPALRGSSESARVILVTQVAVLLIGLMIQIFRWEHHRVSLIAPVFFVAGMIFGLGVPLAAVCAFAIAWLLSPIIPRAEGFFIVLGLVFAVVAMVVYGGTLVIAIGVTVCVIPVLIGSLGRRPLMIQSRRPAAPTRSIDV